MKQDKKQAKLKIALAVYLCVMVLRLTGATLAWFRHLQQLNTVALVQIPSKITLSGPNRSELQRISLELTADDTQDKDKDQVTIRRVFCIESTADYWLEVIRTTNIENMDIKIFPVKTDNISLASNSNLEPGEVEVKGTDGIQTFYYTPDEDSLEGDYLNRVQDENSLEDAYLNSSGVKPIIATQALHGENYADGDSVQQNAEPLYWRTKERCVNSRDGYSQADTATTGEKICYRYFILELSWDTSAQETDLVYLLASH